MKLKAKVTAQINLDALENNYRVIERRIGTAKQICVVKADCYGHGTQGCIPVLNDCGCTFYAVSSLDEALDVRRYTNADILISGYTPTCDVEYAIENNITQSLFSHEYASALAENVPSGKKLKVHAKLDTGMNRIGYGMHEGEVLLNDVNNPCFEATGLFTHFACSDECTDFTEIQFERFKKMQNRLACGGFVPEMCHVSNSAATFYLDGGGLDAVRSGISLYGLQPSEYAEIEGIEPVMTLKTEVAHIHTVKKDEGISYGLEYRAERDMVVATLPIGYADGFLRAYKGASVTVNGKKAEIVGRICMDQCMIDVTDVGAIKCGDEVILFGDGGQNIDELAKIAGTINYECVCLITKRVPRIYKRGTKK